MHTLHELVEFYKKDYEKGRLFVKSSWARNTLFCPVGYKKETDTFWGRTLFHDYKYQLKTRRAVEYHDGNRRIWDITIF